MKVECGLEIVDNICGEYVMIDLIFGRRHNSRISGMWHSGSASALHAEGQGFSYPDLGNLRMVTCSTHVGCFLCTYSSVAERSIAVIF